jgi:hypothetical protein
MSRRGWVVCRKYGRRIFRYNERDGRMELAAGGIANPRYTRAEDDDFEPAGEVGTAHCPLGHL